MCTSGAVNKHFLFKNRDMGADASLEESIIHGTGIYDYIGVAGHATPKERGLNSGINSAGVAALMTYVGNEGLAFEINSSISRGVLIEEILRTASDLDEALEVATYLLNKYRFVGGNILINSPQGVAIIEQRHPRYAIERTNQRLVVRTNHFLNLKFDINSEERLNNSKIRFARFTELLDTLPKDNRSISPDSIRLLLADKENGENSICRDDREKGITVSSVVYDIQNPTMYYIYGLPSNGSYTEYRL